MRPFSRWCNAWVWGKAPHGWKQVGAVRQYTFKGWQLEFLRNRELPVSLWGVGLLCTAGDYEAWVRLGRLRVSAHLFRVS